MFVAAVALMVAAGSRLRDASQGNLVKWVAMPPIEDSRMPRPVNEPCG